MLCAPPFLHSLRPPRWQLRTDANSTTPVPAHTNTPLHLSHTYNINIPPSRLPMQTTGGRSARLVNPLAWEKGAVFCQCQRCGVWHTLAANNPRIIEEVRYDDPEGQRARREALRRAALAEEQREGGGSEASDATAFEAGAGAGGEDGDDDAASSAARR